MRKDFTMNAEVREVIQYWPDGVTLEYAVENRLGADVKFDLTCPDGTFFSGWRNTIDDVIRDCKDWLQKKNAKIDTTALVVDALRMHQFTAEETERLVPIISDIVDSILKKQAGKGGAA